MEDQLLLVLIVKLGHQQTQPSWKTCRSHAATY
jgi:hypothetical protein